MSKTYCQPKHVAQLNNNNNNNNNNIRVLLGIYNILMVKDKTVKANQSRYRPGVAQRVPGS